MKKYNITNKIGRYLAIPLLFSIMIPLTNSCEVTELELLTDPSSLTPDSASPDLFINSIQLGLAAFFDSDNGDNFVGMNEYGMQVTRMTGMGGSSYENAYAPSSFNGIYQDAFSSTMIDIRTLYPLAEANGLYTHLAMAQIAEAYIMMTMVDYFGDFPYTEAFQGADNISPKLDAGEDIYAAVEELLNSAIVNLDRDESAEVVDDLFYNNDEDKWKKLANTLKLKLYVQTKLVDANAGAKINAIVSSGDYIQTADEDFQFNYTTTDVNPDSRHPLFGPNFDNGKSDYMGNDFMNRVVNQVNLAGAAIDDPRRRYYFYRQDDNFGAADSQTKPCTVANKPTHYSAEDPFCTVTSDFGDGYWGRDHCDNAGIPPDDANTVVFGVYPVGGPFDDGSADTQSNRDTGLRGAGSSMFMLSSYVQFMLAETALTSGVAGDARAYLEAGMTQSIAKVQSFGDKLPAGELDVASVPTAATVTAYIDAILEKYDAADADGKLDIVIEQYYIALFNNGVEAYNTYRRTGKPDLQPTLVAAPGLFMRTFLYPDAMVTRNSNVDTKPIATQVFWDTNPGNFID